MADVIRARQGDTVDGLVWRDRGIGIAGVPAVFAANPGLAANGAVLAAGTPVTIPTIATPTVAVRSLVQLWS